MAKYAAAYGYPCTDPSNLYNFAKTQGGHISFMTARKTVRDTTLGHKVQGGQQSNKTLVPACGCSCYECIAKNLKSNAFADEGNFLDVLKSRYGPNQYEWPDAVRERWYDGEYHVPGMPVRCIGCLREFDTPCCLLTLVMVVNANITLMRRAVIWKI